MNVLGGTVRLIAGEKAGIIKGGVPAFCVPQQPEALEVLQAAAAKVGTSLVECVADPADAARLPTWLRPSHQQHNVAMALQLMDALAAAGHLPRKPDAWRTARDTALWPARFEVLCPTPLRPELLLRLRIQRRLPNVRLALIQPLKLLLQRNLLLPASLPSSRLAPPWPLVRCCASSRP